MITPIDITSEDWCRQLQIASSQIRVVVWCESGDNVIEAYSCDTPAEVEYLRKNMSDRGEVYNTEVNGA
jgi:hypothetical protein